MPNFETLDWKFKKIVINGVAYIEIGYFRGENWHRWKKLLPGVKPLCRVDHKVCRLGANNFYLNRKMQVMGLLLKTIHYIKLSFFNYISWFTTSQRIWDTDLGVIWHPDLGVIWDPDLSPHFGTPIWDPDLGPWFGTLIWGVIWDPDLGPQYGGDMGPPFGDPDLWGEFLCGVNEGRYCRAL
jgi:hypothetical protein